MPDMKRREFIALLGGGGLLLAVKVRRARGQQPATPVIGFLHAGSPEPNAEFVTAFRRGLREAGFVEGQNVTIEYRWAEGQLNRLPEMAADLVHRHVAVIATPLSTQATLAAKTATTTIPIIFGSGADPVALGLVSSFSRPGGNVTGISIMTAALAAIAARSLARNAAESRAYWRARQLPQCIERSYRKGPAGNYPKAGDAG